MPVRSGNPPPDKSVVARLLTAGAKGFPAAPMLCNVPSALDWPGVSAGEMPRICASRLLMSPAAGAKGRRVCELVPLVSVVVTCFGLSPKVLLQDYFSLFVVRQYTLPSLTADDARRFASGRAGILLNSLD